jgi:hypothetical protein
MNNVIRLFNRLLADVSHKLGRRLCAPQELDMQWILNEGPRLDKLLLRYLEDGGLFPEFPEWLRSLTETVERNHLRHESGLAASLDSVVPIRLLRQILVFGYKAEYEPTETQQKEAQASFVETDDSLEIFDSVLLERHHSTPMFAGARKLVSRVIANTDWRSIRPAHGPGAVFPSCRPSEKSRFDTIYNPIEQYYPYFEFFEATSSRIEFSGDRYDALSCKDKIIARLTCVPKDSRGPRLISVHPRESIWIQQGLRRKLEDAIARSPLTSRTIQFANQKQNQARALHGSLTGSYATIDLKDASDRISLELFRTLFGSAAQYFECCRASHVKLLDGSLHTLRKYAPMGNATTFPVESLCFWALVRSGIECLHGVICDDIYVFGDDLIVPSEYCQSATRALVRAGLIPNTSKCFSKGLFRESCGVDAYCGHDITPIRLKKHQGRSLLDLVSLCALGRNLRLAGYEETAAAAYTIVRNQRRGWLAITNNPLTCGIVEYVDWDLSRLWNFWTASGMRWSKRLHRYEVKVPQVEAVKDRFLKHDWYHVLDSLLRLEQSRLLASSGLEYTVPYRTRCNDGWTPLVERESARQEARRILELAKSRMTLSPTTGCWFFDDTLTGTMTHVSKDILIDMLSLG